MKFKLRPFSVSVDSNIKDRNTIIDFKKSFFKELESLGYIVTSSPNMPDRHNIYETGSIHNYYASVALNDIKYNELMFNWSENTSKNYSFFKIPSQWNEALLFAKSEINKWVLYTKEINNIEYKNHPQTFSVINKSNSFKIRDAMITELEKIGYTIPHDFKEYNDLDFCVNISRKISESASKEEFRQLICLSDGNKHKIFYLPEDWNKIIEFAKAQINHHKFSEKVLQFGNIKFKLKGNVAVSEEWGSFSKDEIRSIKEWLDKAPKIKSYPISIDKIKIGCKEGTVEQIKEIYNNL